MIASPVGQQRAWTSTPTAASGPSSLPLPAVPTQAPAWARVHQGWSEQPAPWPPPVRLGARTGGAPWFEDALYQDHLDQVTATPATTGNWTQLLIDGPASFSRKEAEIRRADVVFFKIYQFDDDASGQRIVRQLAEAADRGAQVYVQYGLKAFFGTWSMVRFKLGWKRPVVPVLEPLWNHPNVHLIPNDFPRHWLDLHLHRDHEKYLVTWRRGEPVRLFMGGMNVSDAWVHGGDPQAATATGLKYRDTDLEIVGPAAQQAVDAFMQDMAGLDPRHSEHIEQTCAGLREAGNALLYPPHAENAVVRFVRNHPKRRSGQHLRDMYIALLQQVPAGQSVRIENAYVLPNAALSRALVAAADRGVKLKMVINAADSAEWESRLLGFAGRSFCRSILRRTRHPENLKFYAYHGDPRVGTNTMHHKVASFGLGGPFVVGSSNLDSQSLTWNKEDGALVYDAFSRAQFDAMWRMDVHNTHVDEAGQPIVTTEELTPELLRADPWWERARAWCLYRLGGYFL